MVILITPLGLYVASALYVPSTCTGSAGTGGPPSRCGAIGIPLLVFVVFETWFLVPMPRARSRRARVLTH